MDGRHLKVAVNVPPCRFGICLHRIQAN